MRVLVVEDDDRIAETLTTSLGRAGFSVERERDGEVAWYRGDTEAYDAIVLDLGLPQMDGLTVLKRWRSAGRLTPVLISPSASTSWTCGPWRFPPMACPRT